MQTIRTFGGFLPTVEEESNASADPSATVSQPASETVPTVNVDQQRCPTPPSPQNLGPTHQSFTVSLYIYIYILI